MSLHLYIDAVSTALYVLVRRNRNGGYNEKIKSINGGCSLRYPDLLKLSVRTGLASVARAEPGRQGQRIQSTAPVAK
jgi:hypothetical protein